MKNLSFQGKLIISYILITFVVIFTFLFSIYFNNNPKIPQSSSRDYFENFVINKIDNSDDLDFVSSLYVFKTESQTFELKPEITSTERSELSNILENSGYFTRLESRDIETKTKLVLNGYLGQLFRFDILGSVMWLVLPSLVYFFITFKKRETWEKSGVFIYITIFSVIALFGYDNFRYQLTLVPLSLVIILSCLNEIFSVKKRKKYLTQFMIFLLVLSIANDFGALTRYITKISEEIKDIYTVHTSASPQSSSLYGNLASSRYVRSRLPKTISDTLDFIDTLNITDNNEMIVNNVFFPFYYTDKPFIYYWSHKDVLHTPNGFESLVSDRTDEEITNKITKELHAHYLLTLKGYLSYNKAFEDYLNRNSDIIFESGGYIIFKIREN